MGTSMISAGGELIGIRHNAKMESGKQFSRLSSRGEPVFWCRMF